MAKGYFMVPNAIREGLLATLTGAQLRVLFYICSRGRKCNASLSTFCTDLRMGRTTASAALRWLVSLGVVRKQKGKHGKFIYSASWAEMDAKDMGGTEEVPVVSKQDQGYQSRTGMVPKEDEDGTGTGPPSKETPPKNIHKGTPLIPPRDKASSCSTKQIATLYNDTCTNCPTAMLTPDLRRSIKARWNEDKTRQTPEWWEAYFRRVHRNNFLSGREKPTDGRPGWCASLPWLVGPTNMTKVLNGNYDKFDSGGNGRPKGKMLTREQEAALENMKLVRYTADNEPLFPDESGQLVPLDQSTLDTWKELQAQVYARPKGAR